jgi:hypothetical protein
MTEIAKNIPAEEHYRRTRELIDYASSQVTKRRALAAALRTIIADPDVIGVDRDAILRLLSENGPA